MSDVRGRTRRGVRGAANSDGSRADDVNCGIASCSDGTHVSSVSTVSGMTVDSGVNTRPDSVAAPDKTRKGSKRVEDPSARVGEWAAASERHFRIARLAVCYRRIEHTDEGAVQAYLSPDKAFPDVVNNLVRGFLKDADTKVLDTANEFDLGEAVKVYLRELATVQGLGRQWRELCKCDSKNAVKNQDKNAVKNQDKNAVKNQDKNAVKNHLEKKLRQTLRDASDCDKLILSQLFDHLHHITVGCDEGIVRKLAQTFARILCPLPKAMVNGGQIAKYNAAADALVITSIMSSEEPEVATAKPRPPNRQRRRSR